MMNKQQTTEESTTNFALAKENLILLIIGFVIIIIGFALMAGGKSTDPNMFYPDGDPSKTPEIFSFRRITLAPIVVLFGFVFEIFAIMVKPERVRKILGSSTSSS